MNDLFHVRVIIDSHPNGSSRASFFDPQLEGL